MKTLTNNMGCIVPLYEGILADMEDTIRIGDEYDKNINDQLKELNKTIGFVKNWKSYAIKQHKHLNIDAPELLKHLGYNAKRISLIIMQHVHTNSTNQYTPPHKWRLSVSLVNSDMNINTGSRFEYSAGVYLLDSKGSEIKTLKEILKELLIPATKDIKSFKLFLSNCEKYTTYNAVRYDRLLSTRNDI